MVVPSALRIVRLKPGRKVKSHKRYYVSTGYIRQLLRHFHGSCLVWSRSVTLKECKFFMLCHQHKQHMVKTNLLLYVNSTVFWGGFHMKWAGSTR